MIQRIQSVWLLLAAVCAFLTLKVTFITGIKINDPQRVSVSLNSTTTIPLIITAVTIGIAALITIFLYKDRKTQMKVVFATLAVSVLLIYLYFSYANANLENGGNLYIAAPTVFIIPLFLLLAIRGIYKDQKLIKSVDRLR